MRTVDQYMIELAGALYVRGTARRRFLRECRDHLARWSEGTDLVVIERAASVIDRLAKRIEDAVEPAIRENGTPASSG